MNFDFSVDLSLTYYLLTVASFGIGVPSILFLKQNTISNFLFLYSQVPADPNQTIVKAVKEARMKPALLF